MTPSLFPDLAPSVARREFLPDLVHGSVSEAWAQVVTHFLPPCVPRPVVADLTVRTGEMWRRCAEGYHVLAFDVDSGLRHYPIPVVRLNAVADCRWPALRRESVDAVLVDVPWSLDPGKGRGYAAEAYGSRFTSVEQVLDLFRGANWASCVRTGGWAFVRIQASHHGGRAYMLPYRVVARVEDGGAWELWDEVIWNSGNVGPQAGMVSPPKTRKTTQRFLIFKYTKIKVRCVP